MAVFKGTPNVYKYNASDNVAYNLKSWLQYGLTEGGAFTQIKFNLPTSGYTSLKRVPDTTYPNGSVYEGFGPSWVWETDVSTNDPTLSPPFQVSGVYINSQFYKLGISGMIVDYELGRVIFPTNTFSANTKVSCEYTMRDIGVYTSDSNTWRIILDEYEQKYSQLDTLAPSGMAEVLKAKRVWLPAVYVDMQNSDHTPAQLGGGEFINFNIFYHIFSEKPALNKSIIDIINSQEGKTINLFDMNTSPIPLAYNGSLVSGYKSFKELSNRSGPYFWYGLFIERSNGQPINTSFNLFRGIVKHRSILETYNAV